jgi:hypothetical protein
MISCQRRRDLGAASFCSLQGSGSKYNLTIHRTLCPSFTVLGSYLAHFNTGPIRWQSVGPNFLSHAQVTPNFTVSSRHIRARANRAHQCSFKLQCGGERERLKCLCAPKEVEWLCKSRPPPRNSVDDEARKYRSDLLAYDERRQSIVRRGAFTFWHRLIEGNRRTCASPENPASSVTSNNSMPVPLGTSLSISCFCAFGRLGCACVPRSLRHLPSTKQACSAVVPMKAGNQALVLPPCFPNSNSGQKKQGLGKKIT